MKKEDLFEAIEHIDPAFVEEGREVPAKKTVYRNGWMKIALAAAAVLVMAGAGAFIFSKTPVTKEKAPIEKHVAKRDASAEMQRTYRWEEMMDVQRYKEFRFADRTYLTKLIYVHPENVGDAIGPGVLTGQDEYTDEIHTIEGNAAKISGVDEEAAVAVFFPDEPDRGYAYVNAAYCPDTLGAFIDALNMKNTLKTGLVYVYRTGGDPDVVYEDVPTERVWELLLSDVTLVNEPGHEMGRKVLSISAGIDLLGYHHHTFTLTEEGYLMTNLLESGKYFNIGKDKVDAFLREVTEDHQGYVYIYDIPTGELDGE